MDNTVPPGRDTLASSVRDVQRIPLAVLARRTAGDRPLAGVLPAGSASSFNSSI